MKRVVVNKGVKNDTDLEQIKLKINLHMQVKPVKKKRFKKVQGFREPPTSVFLKK